MPLQAAVVPVTPFQQNCSVAWCTETMKGAVVDPGGEIEKILAAAEENGVDIEKILITHGHLDHASATKALSERLGVPIEGPHPDEMFWIEKLPAQAAEYGFPPAEVFEPTRWLGDGDQVTVGNVTMDVYHCPGHTPGHVVFVEPQQKVAFVGDVIFQGSIGRTDFPRGNHADLIASIRDKLFPLGDDIVFVPGHGPLSTFGDERKHNPFVGDDAVR
ncbi:MAG: MBL fold metallo-hydrolase [Rhodospirillales bacterium]